MNNEKIKFKCKFCEKLFTKETYLERHMIKIHGPAIPQTDGFNDDDNYNLGQTLFNINENDEEVEKYRCCLSACNKRFMSIDDVIAHGVKVHKRFPVPCPVATCGVPYQEFKNNTDLNVHVKISHPEENM